MTSGKLDDLALLTAANPVHEPLDEAEHADALLERILSEPADQPIRRSPRRRPQLPRHVTLAGAGALGLAVIAVVLAFPGGKSADALAQAVAALGGEDGVFHVVTQTTTVDESGGDTRIWTETWAPADGRRSRSLTYDAAPDGSRGRLIAEKVGSTRAIWSSPRDGGSISDGDDAAIPRSYVLSLLRNGRVTHRTEVKYAGRQATRFDVETRMSKSINKTPAGLTEVPAYTRRTVVIVDRRTDFPLLLRTSGLVGTSAASRTERVAFRRETTTSRFTAFERLADSRGAAGLKPSARFRNRNM